MSPDGLVAVIVTVHEAGVVLGALAFGLVASAAALLLRRLPIGRRTLAIVGFGLGAGLATHATTSRVARVTAVDVEIVRVD
jgi:hypothetical protein